MEYLTVREAGEKWGLSRLMLKNLLMGDIKAARKSQDRRLNNVTDIIG